MYYIIPWIICLVPHTGIPIHQCETIELNHFGCLKENVWGNKPEIQITSWILGRNSEYIEWYIKYEKQPIWHKGKQNLIILYNKGGIIIVLFKYFIETWTTYDVELDERYYLNEKYGVTENIYRTGLVRNSE